MKSLRLCPNPISPNLDITGTLKTADIWLIRFVQSAGKSNKTFNFKNAQLGKFVINTGLKENRRLPL